MLIYATAKNIRISPTKVRLVTEKIRRLTPQQAIDVLAFVPNASALPLKKVIASALANAKNNHGLLASSLVIKEIVVNKGPVSKRFRAIARGRAHSILKRSSHIKIILEEIAKPEQKKEIAEEPKIELEEISKKQVKLQKGGKNGTKS